ncbi:hypothetical protein GE09DRAFT_1060398 [Coniochaeta sp. 2T2.1]|nr:hypothetical protein GE09DRAFT_1060398 [Coniochaeta sp. 2T2.1]
MPSILPLRGASNLQAWRSALLLALDIRGIADYVLKEDFPKEQRIMSYCSLAILNSTTQIHQRLWESDFDISNLLRKDPKEFFDHVIDTVSADGVIVGDLLHEFQTISPLDTPCLHAFQARVDYVRRRVAQLGCSISETGAVSSVVRNLGDYDEDWHHTLAAAIPFSWTHLMDLIEEVGTEEDCDAVNRHWRDLIEQAAGQE